MQIRCRFAIAAVVLAVCPFASAQELYRQNPFNTCGGPSAQDARNPGGLGWFSEVQDNFEAQAGWVIGSIEFWGGYCQDLPGNTEGFMIRFYDDSDGVPDTLLSTQDIPEFTEVEYFAFPGNLRGYHYTLDLDDAFEVPAAGQYWISITAILARGGTANEPQWGWVDSPEFHPPIARQRFFNVNPPLSNDMSFVLTAAPTGPGCDPDFNCDGNADQDDVGCIINVVAGNPGCECQDPDFNGDGNVDQDDVGALINVVAGGDCP